MVILLKIINLFRKKKPLPDKIEFISAKERLRQLDLLMQRMDAIDRRRKIHEKFIDSVVKELGESFMEKDKDGVFIFLTDKRVLRALKGVIDKE